MIRLPHTIETFSGVEFDYHEPYVNAADVAHGLSNVCRFAGQTARFYSVAEHSVLVSRLVAQVDPSLALGALWHDAHEAYLGDIATPLKDLIGKKYKALAEGIDDEVLQFLGLTEGFSLRHPAIKHADETAMLFEASILMHGPGWQFTRETTTHQACTDVVDWYFALLPGDAEHLFRREYKKLSPWGAT